MQDNFPIFNWTVYFKEIPVIYFYYLIEIGRTGQCVVNVSGSPFILKDAKFLAEFVSSETVLHLSYKELLECH